MTAWVRKLWKGILVGLAVVVLVTDPAAAQKRVVRVMTTETDPNSVSALKQIIEEYQRLKPDVVVQPEFLGWSDIFKRLVAAKAAGDPPDVVTIFESQVSVLVDQDFLTPVDDVVDRIGRQDYFPNVLQGFNYKGRVWDVPTILTVDVMWYRKDLYEKKGLRVPTTWAELVQNARALHQPPDVYGIAFPVATSLATDDMTAHSRIWTNGGTLFDRGGKVALDQPEVVEAMEHIRELAKYAPPGIASYSHLEMINSYVTGKLAHTQYGMRILAHMQRHAPELMNVTGTFLLPRGPRPNGRHVSHLWVKGWAIPRGAKQPEAAKDFVHFLETGDRQIRWLHSVPIHDWAPRQSTAKSEAFLSHPLMKTPLGQDAVRILGEAVAHGVFPTLETGVFNPHMPKVLEARILSRLVQRVVVGNVPPSEAVKLADKEVRDLIGER